MPVVVVSGSVLDGVDGVDAAGHHNWPPEPPCQSCPSIARAACCEEGLPVDDVSQTSQSNTNKTTSKMEVKQKRTHSSTTKRIANHVADRQPELLNQHPQ